MLRIVRSGLVRYRRKSKPRRGSRGAIVRVIMSLAAHPERRRWAAPEQATPATRV